MGELSWVTLEGGRNWPSGGWGLKWGLTITRKSTPHGPRLERVVSLKKCVVGSAGPVTTTMARSPRPPPPTPGHH